MRKSTSLLPLLLLALVSASLALDAYPLLNQLEEDPYGKKLLDIIQVQLNTRARNPVGNLLDILNKMRNEFSEDARKVQTLHEQVASDCSRMQPQLTREIGKYDNKKVESQNRKETKEGTLTDLQSQLSQNQNVVNAVTEALGSLKKQRANDEDKLRKTLEDLSKLRSALIKAKGLLEMQAAVPPKKEPAKSNTGKTSLVELHGELNQESFSTTIGRTMHTLALQLLETATNDKKDKSKVLQGLQRVIDNILTQLSQTEVNLAIEDVAKMKTHEALMNIQSGLLFDGQQSLSNVQATMQHRKTDILQLTNDLSTIDKIIDQKKQELVDLKKRCDDEASSHSKKTADGTKQLDTLNQVIDLIEKRTGQVFAYMNGRDTSS